MSQKATRRRVRIEMSEEEYQYLLAHLGPAWQFLLSGQAGGFSSVRVSHFNEEIEQCAGSC
jgi:hypothetical protein